MIRRLALLLLLALAAAPAGAMRLVRADTFRVAPGETVSNELWVAADAIDIRGKAADDLFLAGTSISASGEVASDIWAAGESIVFSGGADHARLVGRTVDINGVIARSVAAAGTSVTLAKDAQVGGDALLAGETIVAEGHVAGKLRIFGSRATLSGTFDGPVRVLAEDIVVIPGTKIGGDLVYTSSKELFLDKRVELKGKLVRREVEAVPGQPAQPPARRAVSVQVMFFLGAILAGLPFIALFPHFTGRAVRLVRQAPWRTLLTGLIAFCMMPMVAFFVLFTVVGIPFGVILFTLYVLLLYFSKVIVALVLGGLVLRRRGQQPLPRIFVPLAAGLAILYAANFVPGLGPAAWFATSLLGLGSMVLSALAGRQGFLPEPPAFPLAPGMPPPIEPPPSNDVSKGPERKE